MGLKINLKFMGTIANFFLCIYIIVLGQRDSSFYEILRRLMVIFYIVNIYINHVYLIIILRLLHFKKMMRFNIVYLPIFYLIIWPYDYFDNYRIAMGESFI